MKQLSIAFVVTLIVAPIGALPPIAVHAAATPIPGGANQVEGVSGAFGATLFNGMVRVKKMELRLSTPDEVTAAAGETAVTFTYLVSNGTKKDVYGGAGATMADADGVTIDGHPVGVYGAYYSILPGAVARGKIYFKYDKSFVPVKILLAPPNGPLFRISLKATDLPTAAAPSPSPTP